MKQSNFKSYDYTSLIVKKDEEALIIDTYESFGWELTDNETGFLVKSLKSRVKLFFRRDRKIRDKTSLLKLQRKVEDIFSQLDKLERRKVQLATLKCYSIVVLSCVFFALSVFSISGILPLGIIYQIVFGSVGIVLAFPPYFVYHNTIRNKTQTQQSYKEDLFTKISELCEEAYCIISSIDE